MPETTSLLSCMAPKQLRPDQRKELHSICNEMESRRQAQGFARAEDLAAAAGHSVSTWHAWRRPKPTSPKFFDFRDFLRVVGMDVRVVLHDGALSDDSSQRNGRGGDTLKPETAEVARLMDRLPDELREAVRDMVIEKVTENVNPAEPGAALGSGHARRR